jgi:hypothetical protein
MSNTLLKRQMPHKLAVKMAVKMAVKDVVKEMSERQRIILDFYCREFSTFCKCNVGKDVGKG